MKEIKLHTNCLHWKIAFENLTNCKKLRAVFWSLKHCKRCACLVETGSYLQDNVQWAAAPPESPGTSWSFRPCPTVHLSSVEGLQWPGTRGSGQIHDLQLWPLCQSSREKFPTCLCQWKKQIQILQAVGHLISLLLIHFFNILIIEFYEFTS